MNYFAISYVAFLNPEQYQSPNSEAKNDPELSLRGQRESDQQN